jgi:hypothetical protein
VIFHPKINQNTYNMCIFISQKNPAKIKQNPFPKWRLKLRQWAVFSAHCREMEEEKERWWICFGSPKDFRAMSRC